MDPKQENTQPTPPQATTDTPPQPAPQDTAASTPPTDTPATQPQPTPEQPAPAPTESTTTTSAPAAQPKPDASAPGQSTQNASSTPSSPGDQTPSAPPTKDSPKEEKRISLRTVLLIVFLAILAAVLLFIALRPTKKAVVQHATPTPTTKPSQAHSTLTLVMADTTATPSGAGVNTKTVNVVLTTQSNKVSGVQFEIAYDPTVLSNVTVKPGDFFPKPLILLNQVDTKNGKINYAIGIQPTADQLSGTGTAAVISYTLLPTASASQTTLKFLPKTQVVEQGIAGSVLEKSFDLSIPVAGLTPAASSNKSGLPITTTQ